MRTSVGRPRWTSPSTPSTACWSSDARATSASPDPGRGRGQCARAPDPCTMLVPVGGAEQRQAEIVARPFLPQAPKQGEAFALGLAQAVAQGLAVEDGRADRAAQELRALLDVERDRHPLGDVPLAPPAAAEGEQLRMQYGDVQCRPP